MRSIATRLAAPLSDPRAEIACIALLCPLLLSIAVWNGFPLIFYDTGAYLLEGLGRVFMPERNPVYSLFLDYAGAARSLWLIALVQALLTAFVIVETARAFLPRLTASQLLGVGAGLVVGTGLPWYVGQIEPDCFAAIAVLSLYLVSFCGPILGPWRVWVMAAIAAFSVAVHPSHLILAAMLTIAVAAYRAVQCASSMRRLSRSSGPSRRRWPQARVMPPFLCCLAGLLLVVAGNYALTGKIFVSRSGPAFLFARLLQDRIVMRLLDETCPGSHYRLCAYKDVLPRTADQWLWNKGSPFFRMNRFAGTDAESSRIIWDSLRRYPGLQLKAALTDSIRQFASFRTGDQIEPQEWVLSKPLERLIPRQMPAYLGARQQRGEIAFGTFNLVHVSVGWLSLAGLVFALTAAARRRQAQTALFLAFVLLSLMGNSIVCGTLSNPHDRYQSRLIWLAPFVLTLIAGERLAGALRGPGESGT